MAFYKASRSEVREIPQGLLAGVRRPPSITLPLRHLSAHTGVRMRSILTPAQHYKPTFYKL